MTVPPSQRVRDLVTRLRAAGWDPTAEEIAEALWLARWITPDPSAHVPSPPRRGQQPGDPRQAPAVGVHPGAAAAVSGPDRRTRHSGPVSLHATGSQASATTRPAFPVRAPAAAALPGLLGLQRALRPLRDYRPPTRPPQGELDEAATAERGAQTGVVLPVFGSAERWDADMHLLMDASPSMAAWERMADELRQTCEQMGIFRDVRVHYLHRADDGTPLIGTASGPGGASGVRARPADQFRDPTGRRLTLVISDCVGPLWRDGRAQRLLHRWSLRSPLAVIQPLPPRLWPRTALPAGPGLLACDGGGGTRLRFHPDMPGSHGALPAPDRAALPVPVLLPTREALGCWAKLLAGVGRTTEHGAAGWVSARHPARPAPPSGAEGDRGAEDRMRAFRASASPGALRLAVYLAAAPLTLPVMRLVQRAMLPGTGPMELSEVLLGGLLTRLPEAAQDREAGPRYEFADGVRELLLQSLDQDAAVLVLKHCSHFVERHFGRGARNFSALAVARLSGQPVPRPEDEAGQPRDGIFAEVPARVVRWYRPDPPASSALGQAERLLRLWCAQADPVLLHRARTLAEEAVRSGAEPGGTGGRAQLVLGRVLYALTRLTPVRGDAERTRELLTRAAGLLTSAREDAAQRTEATLELAAVQHALDDGRAAVSTLRQLTGGLSRDQRLRRHLQLGRALLSLPEGAAEAVGELRAASGLLPATGQASRRRCLVLLDLATALRQAGDRTDELSGVLARAEAAAGDDPVLRLRCVRARARAGTDTGAWEQADADYEAAVSLTARDSLQRCELLTEWGEVLLRRAVADGTAQSAERAEGVLREALTGAPGGKPLTSRLRLLLGGALVLRYRRACFLPDLYEGRHLLEQAARWAPADAVRAEAWLELGDALLEPRNQAGPAQWGQAASAYAAALEQARQASGHQAASVLAARALHRQGTVLERMGRPRGAMAQYQAAAAEWQRLISGLAEVDWVEVQATRDRIARLDGGDRT